MLANPATPLILPKQLIKTQRGTNRRQIRLQKKLADGDLYSSLDQELDPAVFSKLFVIIPLHQHSNHLPVNGTKFEGSTILEGWAQYFQNLGASSIPPAEDLACHLEIFQSLPDVEPDLICAEGVETLILYLPPQREGCWP